MVESQYPNLFCPKYLKLKADKTVWENVLTFLLFDHLLNLKSALQIIFHALNSLHLVPMVGQNSLGQSLTCFAIFFHALHILYYACHLSQMLMLEIEGDQTVQDHVLTFFSSFGIP